MYLSGDDDSVMTVSSSGDEVCFDISVMSIFVVVTVLMDSTFHDSYVVVCLSKHHHYYHRLMIVQ
jgi:hypothetical protein